MVDWEQAEKIVLLMCIGAALLAMALHVEAVGGLIGIVGIIFFIPFVAVVYALVRDHADSRLEKKI